MFKKKNSIIENMTFMAIMAAINVIFVVLTNLLPALMFLLVFILPLTSTVVTILCKKRLYPIYFIVTFGLCLLVGYSFTIFDTLIYIVPSLFTGFIFGLFIERKVPAIFIIIVNTLVEFCFSLLTFFVLSKIVTNLDFSATLITMLGLSEFKFKGIFVQNFLLIISLIQIVLTYLFVRVTAKKLNIDVNLEINNHALLYIYMFVTCILGVLSYFYFADWTLSFIILSLPVYIYLFLILLLEKSKLIWILLTVVHIIFGFLFAFLYPLVSSPNQLILLVTLYFMMTIIDILNNYCFKKSKSI